MAKTFDTREEVIHGPRPFWYVSYDSDTIPLRLFFATREGLDSAPVTYWNCNKLSSGLVPNTGRDYRADKHPDLARAERRLAGI